MSGVRPERTSAMETHRSLCLLVLVMLAVSSPLATCRRSSRPPTAAADQDAEEAAVDVGSPAMLTPLLEAGRHQDAQNLSRTEPPLLGDLESYSGFLTVDGPPRSERVANLFFWFFPAERGMADAPLVLWLQGGPGSSGLLGVFLEHGPVRLKKGRRLKKRRHAWTRAANMLYVDSPVGTGFSFGNNDEALATSSEQVARDLHAALLQFYQLFPALRDNEFFIAGESYAGKYAPALAMAVHASNANNETAIKLKGLALGNPLVDAEGGLEYGDYLFQLGMLDERGRDRFRQQEEVITGLVKQGQWADAWRQRNALIGRPRASSSGKEEGGNDDANRTTLFQELTGFRYRFNYLHDTDYLSARGYKAYVQRASVRALLHVGNLTYHGDRGGRARVAERLLADAMQPSAPLYERLLEHYDVLFYNGQLDVADPYPLMVSFLRRLRWPGAEQYRGAERSLWTVDGELAGYCKQAGRLTEVLVRAAGHMVPADQSKWALDLITKFVTHKPIATKT